MEKQSTRKNKQPFICAPRQTHWVAQLILILFATSWIACSTVSEKKEVTPLERVRKDQELGTQVLEHFKSYLKVKKDPAIEGYLNSVVLRMNPPPAPAPSPTPAPAEVSDDGVPVPEPSPSPASAPPAPLAYHVIVIENPNGLWRNYSFPNETICLSAPLLRQLGFENEVAAAIAIELSHLQKRDLLAVIGNYPTWNDELFEYSEEVWLSSVDNAIGILYRSGYDPRGLISLLDVYRSHPKNSVFSATLLDKMTERAHRTLASYSPLRNPVVRSKSFLLMRKRIQNL